jgi:hypothetical protein
VHDTYENEQTAISIVHQSVGKHNIAEIANTFMPNGPDMGLDIDLHASFIFSSINIHTIIPAPKTIEPFEILI